MDLSEKFKNYFPDSEEVIELSNELNFLLTEVNESVNFGKIQRILRLNLMLNELTKKAPAEANRTGA